MESLPKSRAAKLPIKDALASHKTRQDDFFPSRVAGEAIAADPNSADRIVSRMIRGYQPARADIVQVPKWGGATRPVLDMDVEDRVIYDSLTATLRAALPEGLVNWSPKPTERRQGEKAIAESDARFVLRTDVHGCYEYVQHAILEGELLDLTGDDEVVGVLIRLLSETSGQPAGIPQGPDASRTLADIYLSIVDRHLAREGIEFLRWSDDYRVPAASWRDANRVQARLEQALRTVGLTINSGKTRIPARETYAKWLNDLRPAGAALPFVFSADYETGELQFEYDPAQLDHAGAAVAGIVAKPDYWGDSYEQSWRLVDALALLTGARDARAVASVTEILWSFPHLTKNVARYVRAMMASSDEDEATEAIAEAVGKHRYLFDWQLGWLFHAVVPAERRLPSPIMKVARTAVSTSLLPWFVRARAAVLLSTEEALEVDTSLGATLAEAPEANKADIVAAIANSPSSPMRTSILNSARRRPLFQSVIDLVENSGVSAL